ncbi:hypothetical protein [Rhodopila sp.]|uniref:hypothetical protein n=1 Tax=Rhodopila sp. TaxID=2480087 RepID=UPI003D097932
MKTMILAAFAAMTLTAAVAPAANAAIFSSPHTTYQGPYDNTGNGPGGTWMGGGGG